MDAGGECRYTARGPNLYWSSLEPGDWALWIVKTEPGSGIDSFPSWRILLVIQSPPVSLPPLLDQLLKY